MKKLQRWKKKKLKIKMNELQKKDVEFIATDVLLQKQKIRMLIDPNATKKLCLIQSL